MSLLSYKSNIPLIYRQCGTYTCTQHFLGASVSLILPMNKWNVGFLRERIHLPNTLRFWVEMWCLPLLWSWNIDHIGAPNSLGLSNSDIRVVVRLGGGGELVVRKNKTEKKEEQNNNNNNTRT